MAHPLLGYVLPNMAVPKPLITPCRSSSNTIVPEGYLTELCAMGELVNRHPHRVLHVATGDVPQVGEVAA